MTNYIVKVNQTGWQTPTGEDKPQSFTERMRIAECVKEARNQGILGKILVNISPNGSAVWLKTAG